MKRFSKVSGACRVHFHTSDRTFTCMSSGCSRKRHDNGPTSQSDHSRFLPGPFQSSIPLNIHWSRCINWVIEKIIILSPLLLLLMSTWFYLFWSLYLFFRVCSWVFIVIFTLVSVKFYYFEGRCCCFFVFRVAGFWVSNLNTLSKILVCGAGDTIVYFRSMSMSICFVRFLFLFGGGLLCCFLG